MNPRNGDKSGHDEFPASRLRLKRAAFCTRFPPFFLIVDLSQIATFQTLVFSGPLFAAKAAVPRAAACLFICSNLAAAAAAAT